MNREVLNDYKNKDEKMLLAEVLDKIENTNNRNKIEHTDFLDLAQANAEKEGLQVEQWISKCIENNHEHFKKKKL